MPWARMTLVEAASSAISLASARMPPALSDVAPPHHVLALREAGPDRLCAILPARLESIEDRAFDRRPEAFRARPDRHRNAHRRRVAEGGEHRLDIVARRQRVGIGEDHMMMARRLPPLDAVVELGIGADVVVADEQTRLALGMRRDQPLDQRNDRVVRRLHAKDDLIVGIVEIESRAEGLLAERLQPAQRPHDAHRRRIFRRRQVPRPRPTFSGHQRHACEIENENDGAPAGADIGQDHERRFFLKSRNAENRDGERWRSCWAAGAQRPGAAIVIFRLTKSPRLGKRTAARKYPSPGAS